MTVDVFDVRGLRRAFGRELVLDGVDLVVPEGRVLVLMGPSGAGKTTLVKHLLGLLVPDAGEILYRARSIVTASDTELEAMRADLGVMLQGHDAGLFASRSVRDNLLYTLRRTTGMTEPEIAGATDRWLAEVGLGAHGDERPRELSEGQRKRAALARALAPEKPVLLLDDFEGGLDAVRTALCCDLLRSDHERRRTTVVVTTHSQDVARRVGDVVALLSKGRIRACGAPDEVIADLAPLMAGRHPETARSRPGPPSDDETNDGLPVAKLVALVALLVVVVLILASQVADLLGERIIGPF